MNLRKLAAAILIFLIELLARLLQLSRPAYERFIPLKHIIISFVYEFVCVQF